MSLKVGVVGLPNAGKTTLFNLLTRGHAEVASYPFCTIEPNPGVVEVPDERLAILVEILSPPRVVQATIEFVDVAGLVKGASHGEGLGNQFLSVIRGVDVVLEVLRFFGDERIPHVMETVDPLRDQEIVDLELVLSDLEVAERRWEKVVELSRKVKDEKIRAEEEILARCLSCLRQGLPLRDAGFSGEEKEILKPYQFITLKPLFYVANLDEKEESKALFTRVRTTFEERGITILPVFVKLEEELQDFPVDERKAFLREFGVEDTGLHLVVQTAYRLLNFITFYTFGDKELRARELLRGSKAPEAAGKVHSDMEKGFIKAEVINFTELVALGSFEKARQMGHIRQEGKDYEIQDGDIVYFRFAPPRPSF
ncbi:MAG: redox-regulated ATPase YchF [Candidatus Caldatribacteriaceae bacterium]